MNKVLTAIIAVCVVLAIIVSLAVSYGNNSSNIEKLFYDTVKSLDNSGEGLNDLFLPEAKKYIFTFNNQVNELNEFYEGKSTSVDDLDVYHETDSTYRAYATVTTDKGKYFVCISATGARAMDAKGIKQLIVEKYETFSKKKIIKKHLIKDYAKQARTYGITLRTPGDHGKHAKENKLIEELIKNNK
jgi:hypothetical protein